MTARPWRCAWYWSDGTGRRMYHGHAAAKTRAGLDRAIAAAEAIGFSVVVWEVREVPEVAAHVAQLADSPAG